MTYNKDICLADSASLLTIIKSNIYFIHLIPKEECVNTKVAKIGPVNKPVRRLVHRFNGSTGIQPKFNRFN
ncbi:uncharacterized protein DS421_8g244720 [Arachis hypogaea]|nr:uncharacterized protein DS421_8g244720 [Arachis hypogaea]